MSKSEGKSGGMRNRRKNQNSAADKTERVKEILKDELLKSKSIAQESRCGVSLFKQLITSGI